MLVNPISASASTPVDAGARVVPAVNPLTRVAATDGDAARQRQETDASGPNQADRDAVQKAAESLNEHMLLRRAELHFHVDEESRRLVVTVTDSRDGTVIRQVPSEEALRLAQALQNETPQLFKQTA